MEPPHPIMETVANSYKHEKAAIMAYIMIGQRVKPETYLGAKPEDDYLHKAFRLPDFRPTNPSSRTSDLYSPITKQPVANTGNVSQNYNFKPISYDGNNSYQKFL